MWKKAKAFCLHSATIAWSYVLLAVGGLLQVIDASADIFGDPTLKDTISAALGDAKMTGRIILGISIVNIIARLRSLRKAA